MTGRKDDLLLKPDLHIAEVTLIGSGGYGESIIIHLGSDKWVIIDSCIDPKTQIPQNIEYLKSLNVNLENVELIICTHWHDDHIKGISKSLEQCPNARFCCSKANDINKFFYFISFDLKKDIGKQSNSSTIEFNRCMDIIAERNSVMISANENKCLKTVTDSKFKSSIFSLSPSDFTMKNFDGELASLLTEYGEPDKKIPIDSPNTKSVAVFLILGDHRAILGADLEVGFNSNEGWLNILNNSTIIDKRSTLFKIPHHGSSNGYDVRIWNELIDDKSIAKMTPWNRKSGLPTPEMIEKYSSHTESLYITKPFLSKTPKKRSKNIEKIIASMGLKLQEIRYKKGIIQCRIDMTDANAKWQVTLLENAVKV